MNMMSFYANKFPDLFSSICNNEDTNMIDFLNELTSVDRDAMPNQIKENTTASNIHSGITC